MSRLMPELISLPQDQPINIIPLYDESEELIIAPHRHSFFEIMWCLDDQGEHGIDFVTYPQRANRVFLITPGQVHDPRHLGKAIRIIAFHPGFLQTYIYDLTIEAVFFPEGNLVPYLDLDPQGQTDLAALFDIMHREQMQPQPDYTLLQSLLSAVLSYLVRYRNNEQTRDGVMDSRVLTLLPMINHHFQTEHRTDFYANALAITPKRLNELTRAQLGKTVTTLLHERLMLEAYRELAYTSKSIKRIAALLGFEDPAYFCRFFRKFAQESPLSFRRRTLNTL